MPAPDFEDLIKTIKPAATATNVAAATIVLRLIRSQAEGGTISNAALADMFASGGEFERAITNIQARIAVL